MFSFFTRALPRFKLNELLINKDKLIMVELNFESESVRWGPWIMTMSYTSVRDYYRGLSKDMEGIQIL
jgi:hypothetical protein